MKHRPGLIVFGRWQLDRTGRGSPRPITGVGLNLVGTRLRLSGACHAPEIRERLHSPGTPGWKDDTMVAKRPDGNYPYIGTET